MQVEALQERLIDMEEEALAARSASSETQRLTEENALLANQLRHMEVNIQVRSDSGAPQERPCQRGAQPAARHLESPSHKALYLEMGHSVGLRTRAVWQDLVNTQGLGHNNSKQRIQYHLRLKQELEEMRNECMQLLRERFHLEQCVRCGAVAVPEPLCAGL